MKIYVINGSAYTYDGGDAIWYVATYTTKSGAESHLDSLSNYSKRFPRSCENPYDPESQEYRPHMNKDCTYTIGEYEMYEHVSLFEADHQPAMMKAHKKIIRCDLMKKVK